MKEYGLMVMIALNIWPFIRKSLVRIVGDTASRKQIIGKNISILWPSISHNLDIWEVASSEQMQGGLWNKSSVGKEYSPFYKLSEVCIISGPPPAAPSCQRRLLPYIEISPCSA